MGRHRTGHLFKRGRTYYLQYRVGGKLFSRSLGTGSEKEAARKRVEIMAPVVVGNEIAVMEAVKARLATKHQILDRLTAEASPGLDAIWRMFKRSPHRPDSGDRTLSDYYGHFRRFMLWFQARLPKAALSDITPEIAADYAEELAARSVAAGTYNKTVNTLSLICRTVNPPGTVDPWSAIRRKRLNPIGRRELTIAELRQVCALATGEMKTLLALGIYTGLRLGDCATLRWGEVDLARRLIRRIPHKSERRKAEPVHIPIHAALGRVLADTPPAARKEFVCPDSAQLYARDTAALCKHIQRLFQAAGIQTKRENPKGRASVEVGFHSLRHTFVSLCREAGAPLAVVEAIVGHTSPAMTRYYTHIGEQAAERAVRKLPSVIGRAG